MFFFNLFRLGLIAFWLLLSCLIGLFACLLRPGGIDANVVAARFFSWGTLKIAGVRLRIVGLENLYAATPCIYVGNHQSAMDMATFGVIFPKNTKVIGKSELRWIPVFGFFLWFAGNILINRARKDKAISGLDQVVADVRNKGVSVFIFPEGTRNKSGTGLLPFKKGAFHMAIAAGIPVVPMVCSGLKNVAILEKARIRGGTVTVKVLPPIATTGLTKADVDQLSAKVREAMLAALS